MPQLRPAKVSEIRTEYQGHAPVLLSSRPASRAWKHVRARSRLQGGLEPEGNRVQQSAGEAAGKRY